LTIPDPCLALRSLFFRSSPPTIAGLSVLWVSPGPFFFPQFLPEETPGVYPSPPFCPCFPLVPLAVFHLFPFFTFSSPLPSCPPPSRFDASVPFPSIPFGVFFPFPASFSARGFPDPFCCLKFRFVVPRVEMLRTRSLSPSPFWSGPFFLFDSSYVYSGGFRPLALVFASGVPPPERFSTVRVSFFPDLFSSFFRPSGTTLGGSLSSSELEVHFFFPPPVCCFSLYGSVF